MGLLSTIRKQKIKEQEIRVLVLGLDNAGKTTIINHLMGGDPLKVAPTMGFQIHTLPWKGYTMNIWDVGGQSSLRAFWGNYFDKLDVVIWVVDSVQQQKLQELYSELRDKVIKQDQLQGILFVLLANKIDLLEESIRHSICDYFNDVLKLEQDLSATKYTIRAVLGSTGEGLADTMDWIIHHCGNYL